MNEWIKTTEQLPPVNTLVKVLLDNQTQNLDFVNEPIDPECPFQHYIVEAWRMPTRDELNDFIRKANNGGR